MKGIQKKKAWIRAAAAGMAVMLLGLSGCGTAPKESKQSKDSPVAITVWHYYNGVQQAAFDNLVEEFNRTVGQEKGIHVEGHSQGDVNQLETNVLATLNKEVGSGDAPNIFSSYADTAYAVQKMGCLADISKYMGEDEFDSYVDSYIEEGRIGSGEELYIFPVAKSSEVFMLNKEDWEKFAEATGADTSQLSTIEGVTKTAEDYYNWTDSLTPDVPNDGHAFYGRDAMANYFIVGSMQLGTEIFQVKDGKVTYNADRDVMKKIWDNYYVPFVKGYFSAYGRFRSDDVKIGEIISFTGSITSATYFPDTVELENGETYPIDYVVMPAPQFEGGEPYAVQQGAGMVVTKSDEAKEKASVEFLKWFTEEQNSYDFGCSSGYMPVKKDAYDKEKLDDTIREHNIDVSDKTYDSLMIGFDTVSENKMYTNKAFDGGSAARKVLEYNLSDKAAADREQVKAELEAGKTLEEAAAPFITEEAFDAWYESLKAGLDAAAEEPAQ